MLGRIPEEPTSAPGRPLTAFLYLFVRKIVVASNPPEVPTAPYLREQGTATQFVVEGKPFLMLAGGLHDSSAPGVAYVERLRPGPKAPGLNTVLAPVSWELVEPAEGRFDFTLVDTLLAQARRHDQKLVLL